MDAYNTCCNFLVDNNIPLGLHEVHEAVYCMLREQYQLLPAQSVIKIYKDAMASIRSQRIYKLKEMLTYKAPLAGKCVVTVSPKYTSQIDCRTDKRDGKRIGCRYYCSDDIVFDADWNASVNIAQRSKRPLSNTVIPRDGGIIFLSGRHLSVCQSSDCRKAVGQANVL